MTVGILIPIPREFVLTAAANTLAGAELYVYENTTTTPVSLFSDRACTVPAANPIVSSAGFFPRRYMASAQLLTLTLKNTAGSTIHSDDYVDPGYGGVHQSALFNPVYDLALTTAGGTTAYTVTTGLSLSAYTSGQSFLIKLNATNTGASTLNVDGLGTKSITKNGATALASGDLVSGQIYRVAYDGTQFQVVGATTQDPTLTALAALAFSGPGVIQATASDTFTARAIGGFRANKGGANQTAGISSETNSKVTFTTESWDTGSYYDTTNSRWTPPSGKVRICATVRCENLTGDPVVAYVYKNGSQAAVGPLFLRSGTAGRAFVDFVDNANGTDYYEIYIYMVSSGSTPTVIGGADESYFSGESILG